MNILTWSKEIEIIEITTIGISGNRTIGGRNTEMSPNSIAKERILSFEP